MSNTIVQYVLLRSDLLKDLGWSIGALVAQACHASTAVLHLNKDDEITVQYLNDMDNMHKVILEVPNEDALRKVAEKLKENSISHKLWIEQPENIPTCLALKPYPKDQVKKYVGVQGEIPTYIVEVTDKDTIKNAAIKTKIILNCVGPNTIFSGKIIEACIESGTHYIDMSAEINHILDIYRNYHKAAEDANVLVIPSCGFASIPAASGLLYLDSQFDGTLNGVESYMELNIPKRAYFPWPGNCLVHSGTYESFVHAFRYLKEYKRLKKETYPEPLGPLPPEMERRYFHFNNGKLWFEYPGPDGSVVEFSERYLSEYQNKRPTHFKVYTTMPLWIHFIIIPFVYMYYYLSYFKCFNKLLRKYPRFFTLGYMSHKGPSEKMMQGVSYSFSFIGKGWDRTVQKHVLPTTKTLKCKVSSSDGYKGTAIAMVISSITLLKDRSAMPKGGVVNIGAVFRGTKLVERLANNGFSFEIVP